MKQEDDFFKAFIVEIHNALKSNIPLVNDYLREFSLSNPEILHEVTNFKLEKDKKEDKKQEKNENKVDEIDKQIDNLKKIKKTSGDKTIDKKLRVISDDDLKIIKERLEDNDGKK